MAAKRKSLYNNKINSLKDKKCADCRIKYPFYVMQFDHIFDKEFTISKARRMGLSINKIIEEVKKCEVVCANCHAARTFEQNVS